MQKIFIFWLAVLPLVMWQGNYEGPKVVYFFAGSFLLFIFWIIRIFYYKKDFQFTKSDRFFLGWILVLFISSIFGIHPLDSVTGGSYRHQGVLFFFALWISGKTIQLIDLKNRKLIINSFAAVVILEALIVLLSNITGNLYLGKSLGTIGEANAVGGFLAIGSFFVLESFPFFYLIVPFAAVLLQQSRTALLALLPYALKIKKNIWPVVISAGIIFYFLFSFEKGTSPFENREVIWRLGLSQVIQRPILGFGAETGEAIYNSAFYKSGFPLFGIIVDRAHNLFLDVALWSGIIGLALFSLWLFWSFKSLKSLNRKLSFFAFLIYSLFQPLSIVHWILLTLIVNI